MSSLGSQKGALYENWLTLTECRRCLFSAITERYLLVKIHGEWMLINLLFTYSSLIFDLPSIFQVYWEPNCWLSQICIAIYISLFALTAAINTKTIISNTVQWTPIKTALQTDRDRYVQHYTTKIKKSKRLYKQTNHRIFTHTYQYLGHRHKFVFATPHVEFAYNSMMTVIFMHVFDKIYTSLNYLNI